MITTKISKLGMAGLFALVLTACSSTGSDVEQQEENGSTDAANGTSEATSRGIGEESALSAEELRRQQQEEQREQEMLATRTFYFDFDRSELKPDAREALVYHARQLRANPNVTARLEGHADERGTREYNLALGERRAQAVERYLQVQGVPARQLEVISYGEERPVNTGTSEEAYAQNRRVELVY